MLQGFQTYTYTVTDTSGSRSATFRIAITGPMLTASTVNTVYATPGQPITVTLPTFGGGEGTVTYQVTGRPC